MSAYMDLNDVPAGGNRWLLHDVLKDGVGLPRLRRERRHGRGNLVTMGFAKDRGDAARRALAAGLDMEMASGAFPEHLARLVKEGAVPMAQVDDAVRRVLAVKVRLGLFERPYADEARVASVLADPAHRAEARLAAQRSMVLLRNEKKTLPLAKTVASLAVIGPLADSRADTEGSWMVFGHVPAAVTVLEGLRAKLPGAKIAHAPGPRDPAPGAVDVRPVHARPEEAAADAEQAEAAFQQAVETAKGADVVIAVMGELANMSGEAASRASLDLPGRQEELLKAARRPRQAGRARAPERPPARASTGRPRTCRRSSRRGSRGRRAGTRWPTCSSATPRRAGSCRSPSRAPPATRRSTTPATSPTRPRARRCTTCATGTVPPTPLYPFGYGLVATRPSRSRT